MKAINKKDPVWSLLSKYNQNDVWLMWRGVSCAIDSESLFLFQAFSAEKF